MSNEWLQRRVSIIRDRNERYTGYICKKKADFS